MGSFMGKHANIIRFLLEPGVRKSLAEWFWCEQSYRKCCGCALSVLYPDEDCYSILVCTFLHLLSIFWICSGCALILFCKFYLGLGTEMYVCEGRFGNCIVEIQPIWAVVKWLLQHIIAFTMMCFVILLPSSKRHSCSLLTAMVVLENIWICKGIKLPLVQGLDYSVKV